MTQDVITTSYDLRRMVQEAQAAGFNPLTVLRNGGAAGFATQRNQYGEVGGGEFTASPPTAPEHSAPLPSGYGASANPGYDRASAPSELLASAWDEAYGPRWRYRNGTLDLDYAEWVPGSSETSPGEWEAESERNIAIAQLRMRGGLVTDDGRPVATRNPVPSAGGPLNPISYTASSGAAAGVVAGPGRTRPGQSMIERYGFQQTQIYQADKLPNVIVDSTDHYILPGVSWEEAGGTSRGETWETIYGDELGQFIGLPKVLNDIGHNANRLYDHIGGPRILHDVDWSKANVPFKRVPPAPRPVANGGGW